MPHPKPLLATTLLLALVGTCMAQDPGRDALERPRRQFHEGREGAKATLLKELARVEAAAQTGDQRDRCIGDREAFVEHGTLPATAPVAARAYELKVAQLVTNLQKAQVDAIVRLRRDGRDADADRVEERMEKMRPELAALLARDLRCQVDVDHACPPGTWSWRGTSLESAAEAPGALSLFAGRGFPNSYELRIEVERVAGAGELHVAFPYLLEGKRSHGFLAVSGDDIVLAAKDTSSAETTFHRPGLLRVGGRLPLAIVVENGVFRLAVGDREVLSTGLDNLAVGTKAMAAIVDGTAAPFLVPTAGAVVRLHAAHLRDLDRATIAAPAKPAQVLAQGSTWEGEWEKAGACRSIEVTRRDADSLSVRITANNSGVFDFDFTISGKRLKLVGMRHVRTARKGGVPMGFDDVSGSGTVSKDGFRFTFKTRRMQPRRRDEWTGTIRAKAPE